MALATFATITAPGGITSATTETMTAASTEYRSITAQESTNGAMQIAISAKYQRLSTRDGCGPAGPSGSMSLSVTRVRCPAALAPKHLRPGSGVFATAPARPGCRTHARPGRARPGPQDVARLRERFTAWPVFGLPALGGQEAWILVLRGQGCPVCSLVALVLACDGRVDVVADAR